MVTPPPFAIPFNMKREAAANVQAGFTGSGPSVGLQIAGRRLGDASMLRAAASLEATKPWTDAWPAIAQ
jgi:Asp-tRNA(Asn)/Glu-tRNA(Gln) amidotransferase A subunit family amidase